MKFKQLFEKAIFVDKELKEIRNIFKSYENKVKGNIDDVLMMINKQLEKYDIIMSIKPDFVKYPSKNFLEGLYDAYDKNIHIYMPMNYYELVDENHVKLFKLIINTIEHEMIHKEQYKKRNNLIRPYLFKNITRDNFKDHFSQIDEIMTYAKGAINELELKYTKNEILKAFRDFKGDKNDILFNSEIIMLYYKCFRKEKPDVWKRFLKYMYQYLENV